MNQSVSESSFKKNLNQTPIPEEESLSKFESQDTSIVLLVQVLDNSRQLADLGEFFLQFNSQTEKFYSL